MRRAAPRALVVDDDVPTCELLELALADDGWHVQARTCPQAALALLKEWAVDVILLDLIMSEMNAEAFLDACRQQGSGETPILLLSAAPGLDEHAARLGVSGSMAKPFEIDALCTRLRQLVAQVHAASAARGAPDGH
jgi:two-component system, OmpR family, response regulator